ncbi:hypothetical protein N2152v2_006451 [Parachlorella kessleri]
MELAYTAVGTSPTAQGPTRPTIPQRQLASTRHPTRRNTLQTIAAGLAAGIPAEGDASSKSFSSSQQYCCRVYAATDVHADYARNMQWCKELSATQHRHDALIVAGDVSDDLGLLEEALSALAGKFGWVFFTPGNHELWLRRGDVGVEDSLQKLELVLELCSRLGVHTQPLRIGRHRWVVPLLSWHHASFDQEPDMPDMPATPKLATADYIACRWPPGLSGNDDRLGSQGLADWFDAQNDSEAWQQLLADRAQYDVISFSHFLPSQALLPEKRFLYYPHLPKAVGSLPLGRRVRQLQPDIHIFGHTHFAWDQSIDGVRYIQAPLCSPAERQRRILTVAFETCMEQAQADPDSASWLPLQIYQCMLSAAELPPSCSGGPGSLREPLHGSSSSRGGVADCQTARSDSHGSLDAAAAEGSAADDVIDSIDHAMHGLLTDTEAEAPAAVEQPPEEHLSAPLGSSTRIGSRSSDPINSSSSPGRRQDPAHAMEATQTLEVAPLPEGAVQLRHGWMPGDLGAHWSRYYETHARDPSCMELAPWVQRLYEKRLRRRANAAAAGSSSSNSGSQVGAEPAAAAATTKTVAATAPGPAMHEAPAAATRAK